MDDHSERAETASTDSGPDVSRRDFTKAASGAVMIASATDPAVATNGQHDNKQTAKLQALPPIDESFTPSTWYTIGPFQYQRRETPVNALFPSEITDQFSIAEETPTIGASLPSAFAGGAAVEWHQVTADGRTVPFPQAAAEIDPTDGELTSLLGDSGLYDDFQDWFGIGAVLYGTGYGFTTIEMANTQRAVLESNATVWLNGQKHEETSTGVVLKEGTNYLLARTILSVGVSGSIQLSFRPPEAPVEVNSLATFRGTPQNIIVPDLKVGENDTDLPASVRVTNTTAQSIENAIVTFAPDDREDGALLVTDQVPIDPPLAPFETRRVNTRVQLPDGANSSTAEGQSQRLSASKAAAARAETTTVSSTVPTQLMSTSHLAQTARQTKTEAAVAEQLDSGTAEFTMTAETITVVAEVTVGDLTHSQPVPIRVRGQTESRRQSTFLSEHDESVQTVSYRLPANYDTGTPPWQLLVSLHGANVPSINQAGANINRDGTVIVAPAARGPVNYDHEDLGRVDDLEAIRVIMDRFSIDPNRVFLSGHSMGGHGTWHVGLTHSDMFAAIGPSAGWTDHETYINTIWGRDKLHTYPGLKAIKERALQKNLAMPKTRNAADGTLPIFVLHGGEDTSVPTMQPRSYIRALANRGLRIDGQIGMRYDDPDPDRVSVAFLEVPDAGHWWDKGIGPGNDGVNHPDMWEYLLSNTRDPYPAEVTFYTTNLRIENKKYWITVLEQETVHAPTVVRARVRDDGLTIETTNVARLLIDTQVFERTTATPRTITINKTEQSLPAVGGQQLHVDLHEGITVTRNLPAQQSQQKGPEQYGPLQEIHHSPYRLVYGTHGTQAETQLTRNLANVRSQRLVNRARAPAPVVPDTAVTREMIEEHNLVLFGRPQTNALLRKYQQDIPITVTDGQVSVGTETYNGDFGVEYIYPNPEETDTLLQVETGTSRSGLQLTRTRNWIPTQTATPDYQIYDKTIQYQKWNANVAAGFFDKDWTVSSELGVLRDINHRTRN